ncbi:uncharacterized protein N0V89_001433 [Didymosphaeria variabile]|uniref:Ankyrin n=1 Tax=Didymosphaeria variabile TaxID=1932322 RepID=A0A9W8XX78_9PLEO|nr:uncharacterized protein N0V89_001433 [Didymosphaeria variabile]KAJ4360866.1 hypothetical protein N0V89_001433 [Didymosphaeria variabile]
MNSNGDSTVKSPTDDPGSRDARLKEERAASSTASPPRQLKPSLDALQNGANNDHDDAANESEAETVVLDHKADADRAEAKVIKTERSDDDDAARLCSVKEAVNGRRHSLDKPNGAKPGSDADVKSPVPTSPSSRTTSRHTKETSPTDSARSPVHSAASPPQPTGRGRSASTVESRKRKLRDDSHPKGLEPPRQKAKTEGIREMRQPTSPATPGLGRPHKRSQSTQSFISGATGRKRKDMTSLAVSTERKHWSSDSSENSSSPRPTQTPNPATQPRSRGRPGRAQTSPGRTMAPRRVDKFGSTRLARESEKGNLDALQAAYDAAPEEIDVPDFAGITPLQKASLHGWDEVVGFLISKGCRTDCESNDRDTPLIDAVENGHLDVVKILLNEGHVNPHHQNKKGQRAIDVLPSKNDVDHPEDVDGIEKELRAAMRREVNTPAATEEESNATVTQTKSTSRLLYNEYNTETLVEKAGDGDILAVGELINSNVKINIACGVAASRGGHYDILSILLASGLKPDPDPSKHSETPMLVAIGRGHLKIVSLLCGNDNFNPTRRNRDGKTYWEISEERRGPKWEQERDILKKAYDLYSTTRKSPKRVKKEPPNRPAQLKRKSSPSIRRDRSSSPRPTHKPASLQKSTTAPQAPQKLRRLMSGKEMASQNVKRHRRVVDDETSDEDSDEEVRAPAKKSTKPRSYSDGEEHHKSLKRVKGGDEHNPSKKLPRAASHDHSDHDRPKSKMHTKVESDHIKSSLGTDSADEKRVKQKTKPRPMEKDVHNIKKRRASNDSLDDTKVKRTPSASAKSTPAPPEKAGTPDLVRERRLEEQKRAEKQAEAKKKAAEEAARKLEEEAAREREEEAARKKKAEEESRKAAEEEARKKAKAEEEARRAAEEAEAARKREEEEEQRRAAEEAQRQEEILARQRRVEKLPRALRRACQLGHNRPLHFSGEELGISAIFLPIFYATSADLQAETSNKVYIPSFQAVGILGLPELDLAKLHEPYCSWPRIPFTPKHRDLLLRQYDVALLAQDFRFPMEGAPDFDYARIQESVKEARQQFLDMEGLYWIEDSILFPEIEKVESIQPLLAETKDVKRRRQIHLAEAQTMAVPEKKHKPRKSFMDMVLAQNRVNGVALQVNGDG